MVVEEYLKDKLPRDIVDNLMEIERRIARIETNQDYELRMLRAENKLLTEKINVLLKAIREGIE